MLLRVMLSRSSELAIPYKTFFVPQLAHRHGSRPKLDAFLDDLGRLRTLYDWGITPDDVRPRLREGMTTSRGHRRDLRAPVPIRQEDGQRHSQSLLDGTEETGDSPEPTGAIE